jgi:putative endonuclease
VILTNPARRLVRALVNRVRGNAAEDLALEFLRDQGMVLVARNVRYKSGEIDLVMRDGATLVFVEVRARSSADFGGALESIGATKQRRIIHAAQQFLQARGGQPPACRFDVVVLQGDAASAQPHWIRQAFDA